MARREKNFSNPARKGDVWSGLSWAEERQGSTVSFRAMSNLRSGDSWRTARPLFLRGLVSILLGCVLLSPAKAQFTQQGLKLVGTTATGPAEQGRAVAVSHDGNTMIVGGPSDNGGIGAAWVWTRSSSGTWSQVGSKLTAGGGDFGFSVALSADGNTAIIGAYEMNSSVGAAYIFTQSGGSWSQQAGPLSGGDVSGTAEQGYSVAISGDGNTAIVGAPWDHCVSGCPGPGAGAAFVWVRSGTSWSQQGGKLVGTGNTGNAQQGYSVGLSNDGNTAIVGGPDDNGSFGAAWVWKRSGRVWSQVTWTISSTTYYKLVGTGASGYANQGRAVAISGDGNTAIVGGPYDDTYNTRAVWMFAQSGGAWSQQGAKLVGTPAVGTNVYQGFAVALSYDGNEAIEGGYGDNSYVGAAWVFARSGTTWSQSSKLYASDSSGAAGQGSSVAMSGDGGTAVVGGPHDNTTVGAAWAYVAPDLTIQITDSGGFARGDTGDTFTITVTNQGAASADGSTVTVSDTLTAGLTLTGMSGSGWSCTPPTCTRTLSDPLAGGGSSYPPITATVNVSSNAASSQTYRVTVSGGGEVDTGNDSATDHITLPPVPDLVVSVSHSGSWYQGRTGVSYTIRVANIGGGATSGTVSLTDTLTPKLTETGFSAGSGWSCSWTGHLGCTNTNTLAAGAFYPAITVTVNVASDATSPQTNHATVSGGGELTVAPYNNNDDGYDNTVIGTAASGPDMTVASTHVGNFVKGQTGAVYEIWVTNSGASPTSGTVTAWDALPTGLTATAISGIGWSCTLGTLTCTRSDVLLPGLTYRVIIVTVTVSPSMSTGNVTNTVHVSGGGEAGAAALANDTGTDVTGIS
jgi:uncharacterized repeat protein (TIGR01451 family)